MQITPTTGAPSTGSNAKPETAGPGASGSIGGDFQTFLTLLTTQMRNQDPLKPMESTEFVAQLASFSAVEQQVRSNDRLDGILAALAGGNAAGLAQWIGREVRAPAKAMFAGDPVEVGVTPVEDADKGFLVVRNDFEQVIARRAVEPGVATVTWDGLDDMGNPAAHGRYGFALESYKGDTLLDTQTASVFAEVTEVRIVDGEPMLVVEGGAQVALDTVSGVR